METPRHRSERRLTGRAALGALKLVALGGLLSLVVVGGVSTGASEDDDSAQSRSALNDRVVERAMAAHDCTDTSLVGDSLPESALIRTAAGRVRQVSFEFGWDVYNGRRPGTLIAVCLDDTEADPLVQVHG